MMNTVIEQVEYSLYEAIRVKVVESGLTPDILSYDLTSNIDYKKYLADLTTIKQSKGYAVELFGTGASIDRGQQKVSRILFNQNSLIPGSFGQDPFGKIEGDGQGGFLRRAEPSLTYDLLMDCIIEADNQDILRTLMGLVLSGIPVRSFIDPTPFGITLSPFYCGLESSFSLDQDSHGILIQGFTYIIPDLIIGEDIIGTDSYAPIDNINFGSGIANHLGFISINN